MNNKAIVIGVLIAITLFENSYAGLSDQLSFEKLKDKSKDSFEKSKYKGSKQPKGSSHEKPKAHKQEKFDEEIEKLISDMYLIGDPERTLPEQEKEMINRMCRNHQKKDEKMKDYIKKKYSSSLASISAFDITVKAINKKNDDYCATKGSRKDYYENAAEINKVVKELAKARQNHINGLLTSINDNDVADITSICCSFWRYKNETLEAIENEDVKGFVAEMIVDYNVNAHTHICRNHNEDADKCEQTNKKPKIDWNHSVLSAGFYAVSKTPSFDRRR